MGPSAWQYGGVYADLDSECARPLDVLVAELPPRTFVADALGEYECRIRGWPLEFGCANHAFLLGPPGHPFARAFLDQTLELLRDVDLVMQLMLETIEHDHKCATQGVGL